MLVEILRLERERPNDYAPSSLVINDGSFVMAQQTILSRSASFLALWLVALLNCGSSVADDDVKADGSNLPNIYLDLSTDYAITPANTFSFGFRGFRTLSASSSQSATLNAPLTVDINDWLTIYGGVSAVTSKTEATSWTTITPTSWNIGFVAELVQQAAFVPKVGVQTTFSRTLDNSAAGPAASSLSTVLETGYALDEDETRGVLAGIRYTRVFADSALIRVEPAIVGYVGGYFKGPDNWKVTGRAGIQTFGGANIGSLIQIDSFTKPMLRVDFDHLDDNENRLFGLSVEIAWTPRPGFQMTMSTPLYASRK